MNETVKNQIREHRQAYLESCKVIEEEAISILVTELGLPPEEIKGVWYEIRGADN